MTYLALPTPGHGVTKVKEPGKLHAAYLHHRDGACAIRNCQTRSNLFSQPRRSDKIRGPGWSSHKPNEYILNSRHYGDYPASPTTSLWVHAEPCGKALRCRYSYWLVDDGIMCPASQVLTLGTGRQRVAPQNCWAFNGSELHALAPHPPPHALPKPLCTSRTASSFLAAFPFPTCGWQRDDFVLASSSSFICILASLQRPLSGKLAFCLGYIPALRRIAVVTLLASAITSPRHHNLGYLW